VRDLRKHGTLKRSSTNPNLIVVSSILAYQEVRQNTGKSDGKNTDSFPLVTTEQAAQNADASDENTAGKPATNGRSKNTQPLTVDKLVPVEV
jgi:hypothetical protein